MVFLRKIRTATQGDGAYGGGWSGVDVRVMGGLERKLCSLHAAEMNLETMLSNEHMLFCKQCFIQIFCNARDHATCFFNILARTYRQILQHSNFFIRPFWTSF